MAKRKIFIVGNKNNPINVEEIEFKFFTGFAVTQKQKSIKSLHDAIRQKYNFKILEISSKSNERLGNQLSAFNLKYDINGKSIAIENIFQSSKVFENGGPFTELLYLKPIDAKKDERIRTSGKIISFRFQGIEYPTEPKSLFYDWIYCNALNTNNDLSKEIMQYDIFTDIEFNHEKSLNCQARSAAIFVYLSRSNLLEKALSSIEEFKNIVYTDIFGDNDIICSQVSLF